MSQVLCAPHKRFMPRRSEAKPRKVLCQDWDQRCIHCRPEADILAIQLVAARLNRYWCSRIVLDRQHPHYRGGCRLLYYLSVPAAGAGLAVFGFR